MKRLRVDRDLTTISRPMPHSGHGASPPAGLFVPSMTYLPLAADHDRKPPASRYCAISSLSASASLLPCAAAWRDPARAVRPALCPATYHVPPRFL